MADKDRSAKPTDEDLRLWQRAMKDARPLAERQKKAVAPPAAPSPAESAPAAPQEMPRQKPGPKRPAVVRPAEPAKPAPPPLAHGTVAGMDKRQAQRLKKGRLPIEGRLDLHSMTQAQAHRALDHFLAEAIAQDKRCVLVITGKGRGREGGGILHSQVPQWLNEPSLRARIVSFSFAQPKDGGTGALYVLLKRKRL